GQALDGGLDPRRARGRADQARPGALGQAQPGLRQDAAAQVARAGQATSTARSATSWRPEARFARAPTTAPHAPPMAIESCEATAWASIPTASSSPATAMAPVTAPAAKPNTTRTRLVRSMAGRMSRTTRPGEGSI